MHVRRKKTAAARLAPERSPAGPQQRGRSEEEERRRSRQARHGTAPPACACGAGERSPQDRIRRAAEGGAHILRRRYRARASRRPGGRTSKQPSTLTVCREMVHWLRSQRDAPWRPTLQAPTSWQPARDRARRGEQRPLVSYSPVCGTELTARHTPRDLRLQALSRVCCARCYAAAGTHHRGRGGGGSVEPRALLLLPAGAGVLTGSWERQFNSFNTSEEERVK